MASSLLRLVKNALLLPLLPPIPEFWAINPVIPQPQMLSNKVTFICLIWNVICAFILACLICYRLITWKPREELLTKLISYPPEERDKVLRMHCQLFGIDSKFDEDHKGRAVVKREYEEVTKTFGFRMQKSGA